MNSGPRFPSPKEKFADFRPDVAENESYRLGFKECLSETLRFLVEFEGFSLNQDFVQYPGGQTSPPQNGEAPIIGSNGGGGGFHLTKLVAHLNNHLDGVVESRLKHPQEMSMENWHRNQFVPSKPFEIKVTTAEDVGSEADMPMEESGYDLRNMLLPETKRNIFQQNSAEEMSARRDLMESPVLSTSSQSKGSYKKEIKDRFLRMRVEPNESTNDGQVVNQERSNMDKPADGPNGSSSTFFSSSASSSSGSSNGSLSSNSSTSSFPVFHPNNRGRSYSVNTYGPLCTRNVLNDIQELKKRNNQSASAISIFGFALHPSKSYYIPFHSKTSNLHETLTNALLNECNSSTIDQSLRNLYPVSINVKFDSVSDV